MTDSADCVVGCGHGLFDHSVVFNNFVRSDLCPLTSTRHFPPHACCPNLCLGPFLRQALKMVAIPETCSPSSTNNQAKFKVTSIFVLPQINAFFELQQSFFASVFLNR